jgi:TatD DNase family protein
MLIDTHCHIHEASYPLDISGVMDRAHQAGVMQMICVGTNEVSSREAIEFASNHDGAFASIGIHPHESNLDVRHISELVRFVSEASDEIEPKIVAIGEIGLDYFHESNSRDVKIQMLETQIELALKHSLPIIFHVRDAFDDFWPIFDNFPSIRGELHSFTDKVENIQKGLDRGLYIGVNGYSTFTKDESQKIMFAEIPLDRLLLETDAPFLTPVPFRGKTNEPAFVKNIAEYQGMIRHISFDEVATSTTANAELLFGLSRAKKLLSRYN